MKTLRLFLIFFFLLVFVVFLTGRLVEMVRSDSTPPVIYADSDHLEISVKAGSAELLAGMRAEDNRDGDVTDTLVVVSRSKFSTPGTLKIHYAAFDGNNNVGVYAREATFTDYVPPRFEIKAPLRFNASSTRNNYLANIRAVDCLDGDISAQIKLCLGESESAGGGVSRQTMDLLVTNSAGDSAALPLVLRIESYDAFNSSAPALRDYVIYVDAGAEAKPDLRGLLCGIWKGGAMHSFTEFGVDPERDIRIDDSAVNYRAAGVYSVVYRLTGDNWTEVNTTELLVVVEERG